MKFLCTLLLIVSHSAVAQTTIAEARKMRTGRTVTVAGRVTVSREFGDLSFIQDRTGGIAIYGVKFVAPPGDSVRVTGELRKYNAMLEIVADTMFVMASKPGVDPKTVEFPEDHEGELVRLTNVRLEPRGLIFYPQRAGSIITRRDTIQYWIDEDTDIPGHAIPTRTTSITGVVGRFGDRIQILPRSQADIGNGDVQYPITNEQYFRVLNWNLEFFGAPKYGPSNDSLQIANVALILNKTQPDIAALQEVANDSAFKKLRKILPGYDGRCSSRYSYSFDTNNEFPPQKLCFIYKTANVTVVREKVLFRKMFDEDPSDIFSGGRLPYVLETDVMGHRIFFVNYHGKSGAETADYHRRKSDSEILKDSLDLNYSNRDLIVLGDFNDDMDNSIVASHASPYNNFTNDADYNCVTCNLGANGWHSTIAYDDMIDHQVISSTLSDHFVNAAIVNTFSLIPLYGRTTSDHLPVLTEFDLTRMVTGLSDKIQTTIFPNPTTGDIWITREPVDITILNLQGIVVYKKTGAHSPISLREYAPGLYTLILDNQVVRLVKH